MSDLQLALVLSANTDQVTPALRKTSGELVKLEQQTKRSGTSSRKAAKDYQQNADGLQQMDKASKWAILSSTGLGSKIGQLGYQITDFTTQVQGGQDKLLAFGQQGGQAAQLIHPLAGTVVALGAAFAGYLLPQIFDTTAATDKLSDSLDALSSVVEDTSAVSKTLSEELATLAQKSKQAAQVEIAMGMVKAKEAISAAADAAYEAAIAFNEWFAASDMTNALHGLSQLEKYASNAGMAMDEYLEAMGDTYRGTIEEIASLNSVVEDARDTFGITTNEALGLVRSIGQLKQDRSAESVKALTQYVSDLALNADTGNSKLLKLASALNDSEISASDAQAIIALLDQATADFGKTLDKTTAKVSDFNKALLPAYAADAKAYGEYLREQQFELANLGQERRARERLEEQQAQKEQLAGWQWYYNMRRQMDIYHGQQANQHREEEKQAQQEQLDGWQWYHTMRSQIQVHHAQQAHEQNLSWLERNREAMTRAAMDTDELWRQTYQNFTDGFGQAFASAITQSQGLGDALKNLAAGIGEAYLQAIGKMIAQRLVMWSLEKTASASEAGSKVAMVAGEANSASIMAGIHAYKSTAAIPITGPALAPAAMGTAIAATQPMAAAAISAASVGLAGIAHNGIGRVPAANEGTWLLKKDEMVLNPKQTDNFEQLLNMSQSAAGNNVSVHIHQAPSGTKVERRQDANGEEQIHVIIEQAKQAAVNEVAEQMETKTGRIGRAVA